MPWGGLPTGGTATMPDARLRIILLWAVLFPTPASLAAEAGPASALRQEPVADGTIRLSWDLDQAYNGVRCTLAVREIGHGSQLLPDRELTIPADATAWQSAPRKGWSFITPINVEAKHPTQWGRSDVLTPGYAYRFGLRCSYLDPATRQTLSQTLSIQAASFTVLNPPYPEGVGHGRPLSAAEAAAESPLLGERDGALTLLLGNTEILVEQALRLDRHVDVFTANGQLYRIPRKPERPEVMGDSEGFSEAVLAIAVILVAIPILLLAYIGYRALVYLEAYIDDPDNPKELVCKIISHEWLSVYVVFVVILSVKAMKLSKVIAPAIVHKDGDALDRVFGAISSATFVEYSQTKVKILEAVAMDGSSNENAAKTQQTPQPSAPAP